VKKGAGVKNAFPPFDTIFSILKNEIYIPDKGVNSISVGVLWVILNSAKMFWAHLVF